MRKVYPESMWENLADDYKRLRSCKAIAERYGCCTSLVQKKMHQYGFPLFPNTETMVRMMQSPEGRQAAKERLIQRMKDGRPISRPTELEKLATGALQRAGIGFTFQKPIGEYIVDFVLADYPIAIEADGWQHKLSGQKSIDKVRDKWLMEHGFSVFRFTGQQLHCSADSCINMVKALINEGVSQGKWMLAEPRSISPDWGDMKGESHPMWGKKRSEESRRKQSESRKKRYATDPEFAEKMRQTLTEAHQTPEFSEQMRQANLGNQNHKGHFGHYKTRKIVI